MMSTKQLHGWQKGRVRELIQKDQFQVYNPLKTESQLEFPGAKRLK